MEVKLLGFTDEDTIVVPAEEYGGFTRLFFKEMYAHDIELGSIYQGIQDWTLTPGLLHTGAISIDARDAEFYGVNFSTLGLIISRFTKCTFSNCLFGSMTDVTFKECTLGGATVIDAAVFRHVNVAECEVSLDAKYFLLKYLQSEATSQLGRGIIAGHFYRKIIGQASYIMSIHRACWVDIADHVSSDVWEWARQEVTEIMKGGPRSSLRNRTKEKFDGYTPGALLTAREMIREWDSEGLYDEEPEEPV